VDSSSEFIFVLATTNLAPETKANEILTDSRLTTPSIAAN
jgi:hypothetical protein